MSIISRLHAIGDSDKNNAINSLVERATPDFDFFFMVTLSVFMASLGLLAGSETIVIGSMLIAPLLYPILGISLGLSMSDPVLLRQSAWTVVKASVIAVGASSVAAIFFSSTHSGVIKETSIIVSNSAPSLISLLVGIVAGIAVVYAIVKPKLSETLPGIAISVALIPPLAAAGIGFAWFDINIAFGSLATFFVNVFGIITAGMVTFSIMSVYHLRPTADRVIEREAVRMEIEDAKAKAADVVIKNHEEEGV